MNWNSSPQGHPTLVLKARKDNRAYRKAGLRKRDLEAPDVQKWRQRKIISRQSDRLY